MADRSATRHGDVPDEFGGNDRGPATNEGTEMNYAILAADPATDPANAKRLGLFL